MTFFCWKRVGGICIALLFATPAVASESLATENEPDVVAISSATPVRGIDFHIAASIGDEYYISHRRLSISKGFGVALRQSLSNSLSAIATVGIIPYSGMSYRLGCGAEYSLRIGFWKPAVTLEGRVLFGDSIAYSQNQESIPSSTFFAFSPSLRLAALQFASDSESTVSLATLGAGPVFFDGKIGLQATLSLLEVSVGLPLH